MNRDNLRELAYDTGKIPTRSRLIDMIYDYFESRRCENCKYFNDDGECESLDMLPDIGFGCNRFEGKDSE